MDKPVLVEVFGESVPLWVLSLFFERGDRGYRPKDVIDKLLFRRMSGHLNIDQRIDVCLGVSVAIDQFHRKGYLCEIDGTYRLNVENPVVQAIQHCIDILGEEVIKPEED